MDEQRKSVSLQAVIATMERARLGGREDHRLTISTFNPGGLSAHQTTDAIGMDIGFDWTAGQVIVVPAHPLTRLSPEQVAEVSTSVRMGQSWHAHQSHKRYLQTIKELQARIAELEAKLG